MPPLNKRGRKLASALGAFKNHKAPVKTILKRLDWQLEDLEEQCAKHYRFNITYAMGHAVTIQMY